MAEACPGRAGKFAPQPRLFTPLFYFDARVEGTAPTSAITTRLGILPVFTRATSRRAGASMIETSSEPALLTTTYLPWGEKATQFGPSPTGTLPTIFPDLTS